MAYHTGSCLDCSINTRYYIDRTSPESLSKTALEALACGLKVIRWDGRVVSGLPEDHRPERVAEVVWRIYGRVRQKGISFLPVRLI